MSTCVFCGNAAGFLHNKHPECLKRHENGKHSIQDLIFKTPNSSNSVLEIASLIKQISANSFISEVECDNLSVEAWSEAVNHSLHDGVLSKETEERLIHLKKALFLSQSSLEATGAWLRVVKSATIRDFLDGVIPTRMSVEGSLLLSLNLQKGEQIVWAFDATEYLEDRTRREYVGGSSGVSVRVMKGVYYHVGRFKGHAIDRTERVHVDRGWLVVTNKRIHFVGNVKAFRIQYGKIASFIPFSNGLGIIRDSATAKPQLFITHDGWFTYNLVANLARL